jgi:outer membrane protein OmpA-like peptidoglycan-associated protein
MRSIALALAAAAASLAGCTWQQKHTLDLPDKSHREVWMDHRQDHQDVEDERELFEISKRIARGELPKIQFEFDSEEILPQSFITLNTVADWLLQNPERKLRVDAHTCTIGTAEYNQALSERRAKSVKQYLVKQGVPPPSIRYKGWGYYKPIADNSTEENRELNRRVEFHLVKREWDSIY